MYTGNWKVHTSACWWNSLATYTSCVYAVRQLYKLQQRNGAHSFIHWGGKLNHLSHMTWALYKLIIMMKGTTWSRTKSIQSSQYRVPYSHLTIAFPMEYRPWIFCMKRSLILSGMVIKVCWMCLCVGERFNNGLKSDPVWKTSLHYTNGQSGPINLRHLFPPQYLRCCYLLSLLPFPLHPAYMLDLLE
jgi:hypothetical protein